MKIDNEWNPQYIDLNNMCKISQARRLKRSVFRVQLDTMYLSPFSDLNKGVYAFQDTTSDEAILSEINPSFCPYQIIMYYTD